MLESNSDIAKLSLSLSSCWADLLKKTGKFGKNSLLGLTPPPPSDNSELFEFQKLLKNSDPPPGPNSEMFEIQNISMAADPLG